MPTTTRRPARAPDDAHAAPPQPLDAAPLFTDGQVASPTPVTPAPPALPAATLRDAYPHLRAPFAQRMVELKASATTQDKSRCMVAAYVELRAYFARLDRVVGPDGWEYRYHISDRAIVCELTLLGITKSATGDVGTKEENSITSAEAQAFKRACAAFGLGRYLYALQSPWVEYDSQKRQPVCDRARIVAQMYDAIGAEE